MGNILKTTLIGLFFGTFGTTIGGIIGVKFKNPSKKFLSFILSFASGLMLAIVCFDLLPEAFNLTNLPTVFLGILLGIIMMIICDLLVDKKFNNSNKFKQNKNDLLKTGIIVSIGLALHNFPEGLAIGSGFGASIKLGLSLAIAICLHDIPEGISMAVPMKNGGIKKSKVIFYVVLSGITTGIGAFFGSIIGEISQSVIAMCLAFAAGAMIYIVSGELTPEANSLYKGRMSAIGSILGLLIGILAMSI
ncbi:putative divalent heavy-metal cations transporter [Clostridium sp. CAG:567]|nr:putative divalent heavy-metal cations transporter [Clostridium sp. CAG:567]